MGLPTEFIGFKGCWRISGSSDVKVRQQCSQVVLGLWSALPGVLNVLPAAPWCTWRPLHRSSQLQDLTTLGFWSNNSQILPETKIHFADVLFSTKAIHIIFVSIPCCCSPSSSKYITFLLHPKFNLQLGDIGLHHYQISHLEPVNIGIQFHPFARYELVVNWRSAFSIMIPVIKLGVSVFIGPKKIEDVRNEIGAIHNWNDSIT